MKNHHIPPLVMMLETFARFFCLSFLVIGTASTGWSVDDVKLPGLDRSLVDAFIQRRKAEPDWLKHAMSFLEKMTTRDYIGAYECLAPDIAKCMKKDAFDRVCRLDETGASAGLVRGSPRTKRLRITGIDEPFAPPGTPVGLATQIAVVGFLVEDETPEGSRALIAEPGRILMVKHPLPDSEWRVLSYTTLPGADTLQVQAMVRLHGYFKLKGETP